jgi:hypothetical protein
MDTGARRIDRPRPAAMTPADSPAATAGAGNEHAGARDARRRLAAAAGA